MTHNQKEAMTYNLVIMNEINTIIGDHVLYFYKNKNDSKYQGPFYFVISGKNKSSFKVKSIDEYGNICQTYKRTQVKSDGAPYQTNITSLPFTRSGGDYTVYKIILKHTSKSIIINPPRLPSTPKVDKKQEQDYQQEEGHKEIQDYKKDDEESTITNTNDPNILNNLLNAFVSKPNTDSNDPNILNNLINAFPSKPITGNIDPNILNNLLNAFPTKSIII